jgi:hypothetical protein
MIAQRIGLSLLTNLPPSGEGSDMATKPGRAERMQQEDTFLRDRLEDCLNNLMSLSGMVEIPRLEAKLSL